MKILVTGANGFIGKNLISELKNRGYDKIYEINRNTPRADLNTGCEEADFIFHLAGVNRPENAQEFMTGNFGFTSELLKILSNHNSKAPIVLSSSIQADLDNPYGESKKAVEELLWEYGNINQSEIYIYRLPNVFGKWSRPNYNTVIATFCHNIARDIPISISDEKFELNLVYIDDVISELIKCLEGQIERNKRIYSIPICYKKTLGDTASLIYSFKKSRNNLEIPFYNDDFSKKLYSTYLTFLPENEFSYGLNMNKDKRGSFTEILKGKEMGQFSVNITNPGFTKGNHWHHTKTEKFLVIKGNGIIRFRNIHSKKIIEYVVSGDKLDVVDIPPGYTHNIENTGTTELITIMWANELYNPEKPDTFFLEV